MTEIWDWTTTLAYFAVFIIGLITCFKSVWFSFLWHRLEFISLNEKRRYLLNACINAITAIFAICGFVKAFVGV